MRLAAITDGTSQTVAISESIRSAAGAPTGFSGASVFARDPLGGLRDHGQQHRGQRPADHLGRRLRGALPDRPAAGLPADPRHQVALRAPGHSMYNHRRPPNDRRYDCRGGLPHSDKSAADWQNLSLNVTARSRHPGGVQLALLRRPRRSSSRTRSTWRPGRRWAAATAARSSRPTVTEARPRPPWLSFRLPGSPSLVPTTAA